MARILTGIQSTGTPHLGNILGAIMPAIKMAENASNESFLFIADMHSLTQIKNGDELKNNTYATAATWLAFGLDINKTVFYRQSDVPQVTELAWYLSCFFPYQRLTMSKSKGNLINLFQSDKKLRKQIMGIVSDSTPMEDPKDPEKDTTFALYKILASESQVQEMRANYKGGNFGYGHAKQALFEVILENFGDAREKFDYYMNNLNEVDEALNLGAEKARKVADEVLARVRFKVGY